MGTVKLGRFATGLTLLVGAMAAPQIVGAASPADAAKLGQQLTAIGAERGAGGWAGGNTPATAKAAAKDEFAEAQDPPTQVPEWGKGAPDADKPLFTISAINVGRYRENLTESHFYLLQTYSNSYSMKVYPSRRPVRWPAAIEAATKVNASSCTLTGTDELAGCKLGFPFPVPATAAEVIWNHKLRWRGDSVQRQNDQVIVQPDGKFSITRLAEDFDFRYANIARPGTLDARNRETLRYISEALEPARLAEHFLLIRDSIGSGVGSRTAWSVSPTAKRVRREPKACCDNPVESADGMQFFDQVDMFSGPLENYSWKLLGKREVFIPYNSQKLAVAAGKLPDLIKPTHLNPEALRYELHRVWVVEATLKPGYAHTLRKRRFYVDEDSWSIAAVDMLDNYDQPYQFQEGHLMYNPQTQRTDYAAEVLYNLSTERYFVTGLRAAGSTRSPAKFDQDHFESDQLGKSGGLW